MKAKNRKPRKRPAKRSLGLIERKTLIEKKTPIGRVVTFPGVQGRTVDTLRLFTSSDEHTISINFQDRTQLSLSFELGFVLNASLADMKTGDYRTIKQWPPILSAPRNPG